MRKLKTILVLLALILVSWPIYRPILDYGFFPVHDDLQIQRIYEMANALRDGQFPVRIVKDFGYGYHYALFNFYAPLPYYFGAFFNLIGVSYLFSGKIMFFIPNFLSIVFMFWLAKKITKSNLIAFFAGVLYAYFPYRAADNYVRGVTGELFVMMFLPLLLLGIYEMLSSKKINLLYAFSLAGIILSHNIYAYLVCLGFAMFTISYSVVGILKKEKVYLTNMIHLILMSLLSLGLTAFFWFPASMENKFTHIEKISEAGYYFGNFFVSIKDLWQSEWGYGGAGGGMTFMIGKIHIFLAAGALIVYLYNSIKMKKLTLAPILFLFFAVFCTFLTNHGSFFLWKLIPLLNLTQYPMRLIFFIDFSLILFIVLSTRDIFQKANQKFLFVIVVISSIFVIFRNVGFYKSAYNYDFTEKYLSEKYLKWDSTIRGDEYLPKEFVIPIKENEISDGSIKTNKGVNVKILFHKSNEMVIEFENKNKDLQVNFPITNFPGWKMFVNGKEERITVQTKFNLISGNFGKGKYFVQVKFVNTPVRSIGNLISLIGLVSLICLIVKRFQIYGRK